MKKTKNKLLVLLLAIPVFSFGQMFDDIKKEDSRKNIDQNSKGWIVGVRTNFGLSVTSDGIKYEETKLTGNKASRSGSINFYQSKASFYDMFALYRYKKVGIGLGASSLSVDMGGTFLSSILEDISLKNSLLVSSIGPKFFFRHKLMKRFGVDVILNAGIPFYVTSSLSSKVSSNFVYGGEVNYFIRVYKDLEIKLGFNYVKFAITYDEFDHTEPNRTSLFGDTTVKYDFSMNKGGVQNFDISGIQLALQYNFNQPINK